METELQTSQIRSHGCLRGDGMNPPIHPSQFDPLIDALCTHLSGGHGRYKPPSFSPSLINKQFSASVVAGLCSFSSRRVIFKERLAGKVKGARRNVWILNSRRNVEAPPFRCDANGGDRSGDFMDLAGMHQDHSSLGRKYTRKPAGCNA